MRRIRALFFITCLFFSALTVWAQEEPVPEDDPDVPAAESDWLNIVSAPYAAGDKTFVISLGILFPTYFSGLLEENQHGLSVGGTGSLALNYFLNESVFVGGELSGMFAGTRGGNMLYIIPFGARIGYQFMYRRFEFPVSVMVGGAVQRYLERGHFGLFVKPGASAFWRFNNDWSFGLNAAWWFVPEWPKNGHNVFGNFMELTLSARHHF